MVSDSWRDNFFSGDPYAPHMKCNILQLMCLFFEYLSFRTCLALGLLVIYGFGVYESIPCNECAHLSVGLKETEWLFLAVTFALSVSTLLGSLEILRLRGMEDLDQYTCGKDLLLTSSASAESHLFCVSGCMCKHYVNEYTD